MVPYTLSKRRQDSIKSAKAKATKAKATAAKARKGGGEGSDSDEETVSFFSHLEDTETKCSTNTPLGPAPTASQYSSVAATSAPPPLGVPQTQSYSSSVSTVYSSTTLSPRYPSTDVATTLSADHSTLTSAPHTSSPTPSSHHTPLTQSPIPRPSSLNPPSHPGHWDPPPTNPLQYTTPYYHPDPAHTHSAYQHSTPEQCYGTLGGTSGGTSGGYDGYCGTSGGYGAPGGTNSDYGVSGGSSSGYGAPGGTSGPSHTQCSVSSSGPSGVPETGEVLGGAGPGITIDSETVSWYVHILVELQATYTAVQLSILWQ